MSFLKGKNGAGAQTLVAVSQIATVTDNDGSTTVELINGDVISLELGFQAVSNRLKDLGAEIA